MRREVGWSLAVGLGVLALAGCQKKGNETAATNTAQASNMAAVGPTNTSGARPKRKPGLWEQTNSFEGVVQVTRMCLDEAVDEQLGFESRGPGANGCSQSTVRPSPGGWTFDSVCDMGESGKVTTHGVATGDMASKYKVDVESTTSGAAAPQANGTHKFSMSAEWKGPCPAGMKPGDIELPGGMRVNALNGVARQAK